MRGLGKAFALPISFFFFLIFFLEIPNLYSRPEHQKPSVVQGVRCCRSTGSLLQTAIHPWVWMKVACCLVQANASEIIKWSVCSKKRFLWSVSKAKIHMTYLTSVSKIAKSFLAVECALPLLVPRCTEWMSVVSKLCTLGWTGTIPVTISQGCIYFLPWVSLSYPLYFFAISILNRGYFCLTSHRVFVGAASLHFRTRSRVGRHLLAWGWCPGLAYMVELLIALRSYHLPAILG